MVARVSRPDKPELHGCTSLVADANAGQDFEAVGKSGARQVAAALHRHVDGAARPADPDVVDAEAGRHVVRRDDEGGPLAAGDPDPEPVPTKYSPSPSTVASATTRPSSICG